MAAAFGVRAYGSELSQARIDHARRHGIEVIGWDDIPSHQFHFINTEQVFEHIPDPAGTLRHLLTALRPEGLIRISVPDGAGIRQRLREPDWAAPKFSAKSLNPVAPLEHINCFTHEALVRMARAAGLEPVRLPLMLQYKSLVGWRPGKAMLKNLVRPVVNNYLRLGTSLLFRHGRGNPSPAGGRGIGGPP
jgi:SAM-dependent methyltransferase